MKLGKRLLRAPVTQRFLIWLATAYLGFVGKRFALERQMPAETEAIIASEAPAVYCFWHGRMGIIAHAWPGRRDIFHLMISVHRDGMLIAKVMEERGYRILAGSSRRGGATALRGALAALAKGEPIGITPDGPRGPRMRMKAGAVRAARDAGVPLIAVTGNSARHKRFGSWDRLILPLPWTRAVLYCSAPFEVPADADATACREIAQNFEAEMNRLSEAADRHFGHGPIEPDARA